MELTEGFNKSFIADSTMEFSRPEVDSMLLKSDRWNFSYKKFEVYKVFVAFEEDEDIFKVRPVVVIRDNGDTVDCYKCTSKFHKDRDNYYTRYPVEDWELAGFTKPSYICLDSKVVINKDFFYQKMGKLKSNDIDNLQEIGL